MHIYDLAHELNVEPIERLLDPAVVSAHSEAIVRILSPRLEMAADGRMLPATWSAAEVFADRQSVRLGVRFSLDRPPGSVAVAASLFPYDPHHQTFVNIYEGDALTTQAILDRGTTRFEYFAGTRQGVAGGHPQIRAGGHPSHPDRPGPPAVSGRAAAARRLDPAAGCSS